MHASITGLNASVAHALKKATRLATLIITIITIIQKMFYK